MKIFIPYVWNKIEMTFYYDYHGDSLLFGTSKLFINIELSTKGQLERTQYNM